MECPLSPSRLSHLSLSQSRGVPKRSRTGSWGIRPSAINMYTALHQLREPHPLRPVSLRIPTPPQANTTTKHEARHALSLVTTYLQSQPSGIGRQELAAIQELTAKLAIAQSEVSRRVMADSPRPSKKQRMNEACYPGLGNMSS
jgi:hypothetical protein